MKKETVGKVEKKYTWLEYTRSIYGASAKFDGWIGIGFFGFCLLGSTLTFLTGRGTFISFLGQTIFFSLVIRYLYKNFAKPSYQEFMDRLNGKNKEDN